MSYALTIRDPWLTAIMRGHKRVENRTWRTDYRGELYLHCATKLAAPPEVEECLTRMRMPFTHFTMRHHQPRGHIVAVCELHDVVQGFDDPWAVPGQWHWLIRNVRAIRSVPARGALKLWTPPWSREPAGSR